MSNLKNSTSIPSTIPSIELDLTRRGAIFEYPTPSFKNLFSAASKLQLRKPLWEEVLCVTDELIESVGGIEAPVEAQTLFEVPGTPEGPGWITIEVKRDRGGVIREASMSVNQSNDSKGLWTRSVHCGTVVFWSSGRSGKLNVGFTSSDGGSVLSAPMFALNRCGAKRYVEWARYILVNLHVASGARGEDKNG